MHAERNPTARSAGELEQCWYDSRFVGRVPEVGQVSDRGRPFCGAPRTDEVVFR
jgi:hypothetical protein